MGLLHIKSQDHIELVISSLRIRLKEALEGNKKIEYRFDTVDVDDQPHGIQLIIEITPNVSLLKAEEMLNKVNDELLNKEDGL